LKLSLLLLTIVLLVNCATGLHTTPSLIEKNALAQTVIPGHPFDHKIFHNSARANNNTLHLYIAGDGIPWIEGKHIAANPTPSKSLALNLMAVDTHNAVLIGRPCYFEMENARNCQPDLWTFARFSQDVVSSMLKATNEWLKIHPHSNIIVIGYSGGGTLAMLLAPHIPHVTAVVTIAGNLNIEHWTKEHDYLPLNQSIDPISSKPPPAHIKQVHIIGGKDKNVTAEITLSYVHKHGGNIWRYPEFNHNCCWLDEWPRILQRLETEL